MHSVKLLWRHEEVRETKRGIPICKNLSAFVRKNMLKIITTAAANTD